MDICIMRNYGNLVPRSHLRFEHAVLLLTKHKDDSFLNVMDKYLRYSAHVTVLVSCKVGKNGTFYKNNLHAQYFSSRLRETVQFIPSAQAYIEKHYTAKYRPSITVTDDFDSETYLPKYCPQYYNYASNHFCQLNISGCIQGLNLAHPINLSRFDHQLSLFTCNYIRHKICIKTIIQILPPCFIFFTAFGQYKEKQRYQDIINAFVLFKYKFDKYLGHEIMLVLGGEFFQTGSDECKYRNDLRSSLESVKKNHNVIFLKKTLNQSEKKTLLRLSYAAIYLDDSPDFDELRFAMSLGTPIICANAGYAANMVDHGVSGFIVEPERIDHIAYFMELLSFPTIYHSFSMAARKSYLKRYSDTSMFLQTVSVKEIPDAITLDMAANTTVYCNSVENSEYVQSVNTFDLQNDWYVSNEYPEESEHPSVFEEGAARIEYENYIQLCKQQIPQQKQFYVNPSSELYPRVTYDSVPLPRWSEEDEVCDQMYGDHLFEMEPVEQFLIKDPTLNEQPNNQTEQVDLIRGCQINLPVQPYQSPHFEAFEPPPIEANEPLFNPLTFCSYEPPPFDSYRSSSIEPQVNQLPSDESYQSPRNEPHFSYFTSNMPPSVEPQQSSRIEPYQFSMFKSFEPPLIEAIQSPPIKPFQSPPIKQFQPPSLEMYEPPPVKMYQSPPIEMHEPPPVKMYPFPPIEMYQPPPFEKCQPPPVEKYPSPPVQLYQPPSVGPYQTPLFKLHLPSNAEQYQSHHDRVIEPQMTHPYSKETMESVETTQPQFNPSTQSFPPMLTHPNFIMQQHQHQPMQELQKQPMQQFPNQPMLPLLNPQMEQLQNQTLQQYINQPMQQFANQEMQQLQNQTLQPLINQPLQQLLNQPMQQLHNEQMLQLKNEQMRQLQGEPMQQFQIPEMQQFQNQPAQQLQSSPIHHLQNQAAQHLQTPPIHHLQNQPAQQLQTPPIHHLQNQPAQQFQTPPIHHLQNQPAQQLQTPPIHHLQNQPAQQFQTPPMQQFQSQLLQQLDNQQMQHLQNQPMQQVQNQPFQKLLDQRAQQIESIQQRIDQAIQQDRKETMQSYQHKQLQANQSMPLYQVLQHFQPIQTNPDKVFQPCQPIQQPNQPMQPFPNQPSQVLQNSLPQGLPNQSIQFPQILPNQSIQLGQILPNQPIPSPQVLPNQHIHPPQVLPNQHIQPPQVLPNQHIHPPQVLPNQHIQPPQVLPNSPILPPQVLLNQPIQPPHGLPNQPIQLPHGLPNQPIQLTQILQNQPIQSPVPVPNQRIQSPQAIASQPSQNMPNQPIRPYYIGIMQQYPPQIIQAMPVPMQNFPRSQCIAPNQPAWFQMPPVPPPMADPQFSGSEYATPREYFEPKEVQVEEYKDEDVNDEFEDPARHWEEVIANDSMEEYSAHGSELSETREDAWSGICSDDSPSTGNRSWRVFNNSYRSNSQYSDDIWEEAQQVFGDETPEAENGIQYFNDHAIDGSLNVGKNTVEVNQENGCKECRDEQCIEELHAKVNAKLENNQGIDTSFPKRSKSARRKAKRRVKKVHSELSD